MGRVCIGVHVHAEPRRLRATLTSLQVHTVPTPDIVLLPDGADAETLMALASLREFPQLATHEGLGGAACFNRLIKASDADVFVLLESGSIVTPGWLEFILHALFADPANGLAGPSTNSAWSMQGVFPACASSDAAILHTAREAAERFGQHWQSVEPLYCLADFCYAVRRKVTDAVGPADEIYGLGPCWEMDYTVRAVRRGFRAVWAKGAFVFRHPFTARRRREERSRFEASKRRYQDKFCGMRLNGLRTTYAAHCRGDACPYFAPAELFSTGTPAPVEAQQDAKDPPLVSCIMPTCDRPDWVQQAITVFRRQEYPRKELIIMDDGKTDLSSGLPCDPAIRYERMPQRLSIGAKRNRACQLAKGDIVAHWDDDDWYAPDRLSRQIEPIIAGRADLSAFVETTFFDMNRWEFWICTPALHRRMFWPEGVHCGTLVFRKQVFERLAVYPNTSLAEDAEFLRRAVARGAKLEGIRNEGSFLYVRHEQNSWRFRCGSFLDVGGWQRCEEPAALLHDRSFYAARSSPEAAGARQLQIPEAPALAVQSDEPPVSCIMPTFNRRAFVPKAIQYFLRQDYTRRELIIVDDGTDQIADLVPDHPQIRYIRLDQRRPLGAKRNLAIEESQGEIIMHWDDDDWVGPSRLRDQVSALVAAKADICGASRVLFCEVANGRIWRYCHPATARRWLYGATFCYRRSLWTRKRFAAINIGEDNQFVWAAPQGSLLDLEDFRSLVAMIHGANTSAKHFVGPRWSLFEIAGAETLLGGDWSHYQTFDGARSEASVPVAPADPRARVGSASCR